MFQELAIRGLSEAEGKLSERRNTLLEGLDKVGRLNLDNGTVDLNEPGLAELIKASVDPDLVDQFIAGLTALAHSGYAIIRTEGEFGAESTPVPWGLLSNPEGSELLHPIVLAKMGVSPASSATSARARLKERFPNVPDSVIDDFNLERLILDTRARPFEDGFTGVVEKLKEFDRATTVVVHSGTPGFTPPDPALAVLECLLAAEWTLHWWGWSVCMSEACGKKLSDLLLGTGGLGLAGLLREAITKGLKAAITAAGGMVAFVLTIYSWYIGLSLQLNNTPRGVCLQGNWNTAAFGGPAIPVFVWAKGQ